MATKVIPNSLNYSDIKPESIDCEIKLAKFVPTATVSGAKQGDMIKFLLTGTGFFDPYSAYFQFTVECNDLRDNEVRTLDRSAHSFISRIIIRSQGTEIERIENYDIIAAMINDMIYSPEQNAIHQWEGFPTQQAYTTALDTDQLYKFSGVVPFGYQHQLFPQRHPHSAARRQYIQCLNNGASPIIQKYIGEPAFFNNALINNRCSVEDGRVVGGAAQYTSDEPLDFHLGVDQQLFLDQGAAHDNSYGWGADEILRGQNSLMGYDFSYHVNGQRCTGIDPVSGNSEILVNGNTKMQFVIPIYSGIMGLLMPDKKLLPLGLMPLDIEIYFNPHALYTSAEGRERNYTITDFNIMSNVVFFESDIHKQLEAQTAEHGLFIYCNSFHSAPQQLISGATVPTVAQISMNLKSVNSVHFVFMYNHYLTNPQARKLHFVSHNLKKLQLKNGQTMIPQYAIEGHAGTSKNNQYVPFLLETLKAWNKLHDPKTDAALHAYNFCGDTYGRQFDGCAGPSNFETYRECVNYYLDTVNKQANVGRCQYGITLEGEELGQDKEMITGRKTEYPFLVQMYNENKTSNHDSYMFTFLRADFIVYIRPDLQIVTLGK